MRMRAVSTALFLLLPHREPAALEHDQTSRLEHDRLDRRAALAGAAALASGGAAAALLATQARRALGARACGADCADPLESQLRSSNELAPSRRQLEAQWQALRDAPADHARTKAAFAEILEVRVALGRAVVLARAQRVAELDRAVPLQLVRDFEAAATVLASSAALSDEARQAVGWQWGACGWRRCGAQADATQSLSKLRANLGMVVPLEALFYLDVANRAIDEVLRLGVNEGYLQASALPPAEYMPLETLELILPAEDLQSGDANLPVTRGGDNEAEQAVDEYEARMLEELAAQSSQTDG